MVSPELALSKGVGSGLTIHIVSIVRPDPVNFAVWVTGKNGHWPAIGVTMIAISDFPLLAFNT